MPILKIILDICLLRGRPQDLPASWNLFWLCMLGSMVIGYVPNIYLQGLSFAGLLLAVVHEAFFAGAVWLLLKVRNHPERWLQSMVALSAASVLLGLVRLSVLPQLPEFAEFFKLVFEAAQQGTAMPTGPAPDIGGLALVVLTTLVWSLLIMAQVLRHAMELPYALCVLIGFFTVVVARVVELVFISSVLVPVLT